MFCNGCFRTYAPGRSWTGHLKQSKNPNCRRQFEQMRARAQAPNDSTTPHRPPVPSPSLPPPSHLDTVSPLPDPADPSREEAIVTDPAGDLFGDYNADYADEDLPGLDDDGALEVSRDVEGEVSDEEDSDSDIDEIDAALEGGFEPDRPQGPHDDDVEMDEIQSQLQDRALDDRREERDRAERQLRRPPVVEKYPGRAGEPVAEKHEDCANARYQQSLRNAPSDVYGVFGHRLSWNLARWAKTQDISGSTVDQLLAIPELVEKLDLPYRTSAQLNKLVDTLPGRPRFQRRDVVVGGRRFDVYFRDIIECVRALISDIDLCPLLMFIPERHYADERKTNRLYHDMNTGEWWWTSQDELEKRKPGATIIPIILSSDKTQLTSFRNKSAYPVYMTIGNIPKEIRRKPSMRAYVLLGYLPTSRLSHISTEAARRRCLANLFHICLRRIVRPLKESGLVGVHMATADGVVRRMHPLYACYIADYPEQVLCTCGRYGDCARCGQKLESLGDFDRQQADGERNVYRQLGPVLDVLRTYDDDPVGYSSRCKQLGLRPVVKPFWQGLPFVQPFRAITPDVLHQLYQGVIKHLVSWLVEIFGAPEIDARCRRVPPNHNVRLFMDGISSLSFITGQTHDEICRLLLGLILDIPLANRAHGRVVRAVRSILDFLYLAQYPIHTDESLQRMNDALDLFHQEKDVFIQLKVRDNFNIPKLHFAVHYLHSIKMFGTTDNFNTQYTERLHIDFAKDAYAATNKKDEFAQMTIWLERKEKIHRHEQYIKWCLSGCPALQPCDWTPPGLDLDRTLRLSKRPSATVRLDHLSRDYGAEVIVPALKRYVALRNDPSLTRRQVEDAVHSVNLRFSKVKVWHRIKFVVEDRLSGKRITKDSIHARPSRKNKRGVVLPGRFDTALIYDGTSDVTGIKGNRVGRIRAVFSLPDAAIPSLFRPGVIPHKHLAYVEWYTPFSARPERDHLMYKVSRCMTDGGERALASIVPLEHIRRSIHLFPKFGRVAPADWTSSNVLDRCRTFYANPFTDKHLYRILY